MQMKVVQGLFVLVGLLPLLCSASPSSTPQWSSSAYSNTVPHHSGEYLLAGLLPKDGEAMYELEFWNSIKDSTHPEDYAAYLKAYPEGRFAPLAKARYERYSNEVTPQKPPVSTEDDIKVTPVSGTYVVTTNTNVRSNPTTHSEKIGELISGNTANVIGLVDNKPWYQVKLPEGSIGYVYAPLLEKPATPVAETPPPPKQPPSPPQRTVSSSGSFKDCSECPEMVSLPAGTFIMGDDKGDLSEKPAHKVTIKKAFAIGKYEVTVGEWNSCVNAGACRPTSDEVQNIDDMPVRDISWSDATDYVNWLSKTTKQNYRLPTEAEWEYAARAGTSTTYWWGNSMQPGKAHCKDCGGQTSSDSPAKVGSFDPNPYGIHDMNGNVWEWVNDCWHRNFNGAPSDGSAWGEGNCSVRVIRSGSWRNDKTYVHSASRFKYDAYIRYIQNGFRVVKTLE